MARSVQEIKNEMARGFMRNPDAAAVYGFQPGSSFDSAFPAASVENILLYVWAVAAWAVEQLLDLHRSEVGDLVESLIPHRPKWYRDKALAFIPGLPLDGDSDRYATDGMTDEELDGMRVVRHAVATESADTGLLTIKVAGERDGERVPLSPEHERLLGRYLSEVKDAGVRIAVVNMEPDTFSCEADVYYDPLLFPDNVRSACEEAVREYVANLPFDGEYSNMALVDCLQRVDGVVIAELLDSRSLSAADGASVRINARCVPAAGYFKPGQIKINMLDYGRS